MEVHVYNIYEIYLLLLKASIIRRIREIFNKILLVFLLNYHNHLWIEFICKLFRFFFSFDRDNLMFLVNVNRIVYGILIHRNRIV